MKHKVSELEGRALDAAVAKCEGYELDSDGDNRTIRESGGAPSAWNPSTNWNQGGPIIEREQIELLAAGADQTLWLAGAEISWFMQSLDGGQYGPTPLIAAMRSYVASKIGEEIEIP